MSRFEGVRARLGRGLIRFELSQLTSSVVAGEEQIGFVVGCVIRGNVYGNVTGLLQELDYLGDSKLLLGFWRGVGEKNAPRLRRCAGKDGGGGWGVSLLSKLCSLQLV